MEAATHLARIGAARPAAATSAALAALHRAHVRSVPFEDYDIHTGRAISLRLPDVHDKIVRRRRGGYCYELNGLFAALLRELGFGVTLVSAFSLDDDGTRGPGFEHLRLLVDAADGRFIADVGNGASWTTPVPRRPGVHGDVQVHRDGDLWWTSERRRDGSWERGWAWTEQPRELADFAERNRYQQHDPGSNFVGRRMAVLATADGRISLLNGVFSETADGRRTDRQVAPAEEWALLADRFGIVLDRSWAERVPQLTPC
ncbi:arylamine N-acetyltransferase family protein [Pseudonocardia kunmingensis]|uniref:N-hydroxyarylamine O-acetyltransferase n=1 Tax=Pseudonocardia kunmingensis TaxID=630975 RepID=A0A543E407_9PSEU|nr:arylamine N-acetyltransferase [Pseudonocardia kunmingensis]TQM16327.1 N-hydroxyarylamine O-acetyltransferase [Pseudonocardia kunmingensis]